MSLKAFILILQLEAEQLKKTNSNLHNQQNKVFSPNKRANFPQDKMREFGWDVGRDHARFLFSFSTFTQSFPENPALVFVWSLSLFSFKSSFPRILYFFIRIFGFHLACYE